MIYGYECEEVVPMSFGSVLISVSERVRVTAIEMNEWSLFYVLSHDRHHATKFLVFEVSSDVSVLST
jgi:hypothetical protein